MFIPITHEESSVRSIPWASIAIVVICLAVFAYVRADLEAVEATQETWMEAFGYYLEHPYLEVDPRLVSERGAEQVRDVLGAAPKAGAVRALEQRNLDELTAEWAATLPDNPLWTLGLVPADVRPLGLLASMFTHADWAHLLGNLLFFYLTAPFVEDRLGRALFIPFYLGAGILSGFAFTLHYPDMAMPLIGASGAIYGTMGAFVVLFGNTRIRLLTFLFIVPRTFTAPAWVVIPLWFLTDLAMAVEGSRADPAGLLGGTAYWAHVWGFAVGVAVAVAFRASGRDRREVDDEELFVGTVPLSREVARAMKLHHQGKAEEAWTLLRDELRRSPNQDVAADEFWRLSVQLDRTREAAALADHRVRSLLRDGDWQAAWHLWQELEAAVPERARRPALTLPLAEALLANSHPRDGEVLLAQAAETAGPATPVGILLRLHDLAGQRDEALRKKVAAVLRDHPQAPPDVRSRVGGELYVPAPGQAAPAR